VDTTVRADTFTAEALSAVSWASIAAGAVSAAALALALLALGAGLGLSSISPWSNSGVSASAFKAAAGIYLVIVAVMSSAIGGYLAARLRTKWTGLHTNEVFFRDTAHGFVAWAFATVLSASVLAGAATHIVSGAASNVGPSVAQGAQSAPNPSQVFVDKLFRTDGGTAPTAGAADAPPSSATGNQGARTEVNRLWLSSFGENNDLAPADRTYVARLIASQTGISQAEADARVNAVIAEAKAATDRARRGAARLAFWMTAALLFGAFSASLAAAEGGQHRDGTWNERRLVPRAW
jgi:hypothetical protein